MTSPENIAAALAVFVKGPVELKTRTAPFVMTSGGSKRMSIVTGVLPWNCQAFFGVTAPSEGAAEASSSMNQPLSVAFNCRDSRRPSARLQNLRCFQGRRCDRRNNATRHHRDWEWSRNTDDWPVYPEAL
jgi:hypothetical protein